MAFFVGQKVVCVNGDWCWLRDLQRANGPAKGEVNAISAIKVVQILRTTLTVLQFPSYGDEWYGADSFRPVVSRKTDISVFQRMLVTTKPSVDA